MNIPQLETRKAGEFYQQALKLARIYCPEWDPAKDDPGLVMMKLFTRLAEILAGEYNRIPEKHLLAFYNFCGIDCRTAAEAKVPLTFKLSGGSREALVPQRTKVASTLEPAIIFETVETLTPVRFNIEAAYSCNPWQDKYTDHCGMTGGESGNFRICGGDSREMVVSHTLYVADEIFSSKAPLDIDLQFIFAEVPTQTSYMTDYFSGCFDGTGQTFEISGIFPAIRLNRAAIPKVSINDTLDYWLAFPSWRRILPGDFFPTIGEIDCHVSASDITPDTVLSNDALVELKKGCYPFGTMPKPGDALYIGDEECFSKSGAEVDIDFQLKGGQASPDLNLAWEYWNGNGWAKLDLAPDADSTRQFSQPGKLTFILPRMPSLEMGGITSRWLRAVIIAGGYGQGGDYRVKQLEEVLKPPVSPDDQKKLADIKNWLNQKNIAFGIEYLQATYQPPFIQNITIAYRIHKTVDRIKVLNADLYQDIRVNGEAVLPFTPFISGAEKVPSFYLGFGEYLGNKPVNLFFSLEANSGDPAPLRIHKPDYSGSFGMVEKSPGFAWRFLSDTGWSELTVNDETGEFSRNGLIKMVIPSVICKRNLFGRELFWIKAVLKEGAWFEPPVLTGIYPNTVWAENATLICNELVGSSNGEAGQIFMLNSRPILEGQIIEVKEPGIPSEEELTVLIVEEGATALRVARNEAGDPDEVWVRWHEVKNFAHSHSLSRHYVMDRVNGIALFGDGKRGMIPPALPNNILARAYRGGGGKDGNQNAQVVAGLKTTIPNIDSVANLIPATGGRDPEPNETTIKRAPHVLKIRDRAVTAGDFEWLAREASPEVIRAHCCRGNGGIIRVIVAGSSQKGHYKPDAVLLNLVKTYLQERSLATLSGQIEVTGPLFKEININLAAVPVNFSETNVVTDQIRKSLEAYFHPLHGGIENSGWEFGQSIFLSEVAALIEEIAGVKYVTDIEILKKDADGQVEDRAMIDLAAPGKTCIAMAGNELPYPGLMTVTVGGEK